MQVAEIQFVVGEGVGFVSLHPFLHFFLAGSVCSIAAPWRRSKAAKCGEGKNAKAFTLYALRMSKLRPTGEDVKAKKEKLLTCVCTRARWPQVVKGREAVCRRRRKTSGVLIENGELSDKRRGTFSIVWRKGVGRSFDEAEYTGACCAIALCEGRTLRRK